MISEFETSSDGGPEELLGEVFLRKTKVIIQCSLCFDEFQEDFEKYVNHLIRNHQLKAEKIEEEDAVEKDTVTGNIIHEVSDLRDEATICFDDSTYVNPYYDEIENSFQPEIGESSLTDLEDLRNIESFKGVYEMEADYEVDKTPGTKDITEDNQIDTVTLATELETLDDEKFNGEAFSKPCNVCNRQFPSEAMLLIHKDIHYCTKKCRHCEMKFRTKRDLEKHEKQRHGVKSERKYACPICGLKMSKIYNLRSHINRHSQNNKTKQCNECNKTFYTNTELQTHQRSHSGEKPFLCTECGASFSTSSYLTVHMRRHRKIKNHVCDTCGKAFHEKSLLRNHYSCHSGERSFKCQECDSVFLRRKGLKQHLKIHENKKEYNCQHCDTAFNQKPGLYTHMKLKHSDIV